MTGRTHDLAALTAMVAVVSISAPKTLALSTLLLSLLANQIGGIVPDVDQPTAPFWRNLPVGSIFGRMFGRLSGGHRFITHSILGLVLFGFGFKMLLTFLSPILGNVNLGFVWWAFIIGMISHLFMDTFTKEGVPFLLPFPWKFGLPPLKALRITTGKNIEKLIVFPSLIIICAFIFINSQSVFLALFHTMR